MCYLMAYALGVATFVIARNRYRLWLSGVATVFCLVGALSFGIEATHWLWHHHLSWIASFPAGMIVLWICIGIQLGRLRPRIVTDDTMPPDPTVV